MGIFSTTMTPNIKSVVLRNSSKSPHQGGDDSPIVIVGTGPIGIHTARELLHYRPQTPIIVYGNEPWDPYNRVQLSALLAGEVDWEALENKLVPPTGAEVVQHLHTPIVSIDTAARTVMDGKCQVQPYSRLILATGSRPYVPDIPGVKLQGVFNFRSKDDAMALLERRDSNRSIVIIGGGLLGLETARAMQLGGASVTVIDPRSHLMNRQLDDESSDILRDYIGALGIQTVLADSVNKFRGKKAVESVLLKSGRVIDCDTVIIAAGIKPNIDLALKSNLGVGRGIKVNDCMQTSDPYVYAVGECAEHRGQVYGLAQPGMEQAKVAVQAVLGQEAKYEGTVVDARLKILGRPVMSLGDTSLDKAKGKRTLVYERARQGIYRKLFVAHGRVVGAIIIGNWVEIDRMQEFVSRRRFLMPWHMFRFLRKGNMWSDTISIPVTEWPSTRIVCHCMGVSHGNLTDALRSGCQTAEALMERTGASSICGACRPLVDQLAQSPSTGEMIAKPRALIGASIFAAIMTLLFLFIDAVPLSNSVRSGQWIEKLWFDSTWKQFSGYGLLLLSVFGLGFSLRKRWPAFQLGTQGQWRLAHIVLGALTIAVLFVHTGFRLGANLNLLLMSIFLGLAFMGAIAGAMSVIAQRYGEKAIQQYRSWSTKGHHLLFWPFPIILLFHIISVYYF